MGGRGITTGGLSTMTKEELLTLPDIYEHIVQESNRIANMRAKLYSTQGLDTRDKVQSSGGSNMLAEIVIDAQQELDKEQESFYAMAAEAKKMIRDKLDGNEATVMELRYVGCIGWAEISAMLDLSKATLYRYRNTALELMFNDN